MSTRPVLWTIGGLDSCSGAGVTADVLTAQALGVHACTIVTAYTSQGLTSIRGIQHRARQEMLQDQEAMLDEFPPSIIKVGMLGHVEAVGVVSELLQRHKVPCILDPVLSATSGPRLTDAAAYRRMVTELLPRSTLITANVSEAEQLSGQTIRTSSDVLAASARILERGVGSVLIKGGHLDQATASDFWTDGYRSFWLNGIRYPESVHGGGCIYAAAIAASLAITGDLDESLVQAKIYVQQCHRRAWHPRALTHAMPGHTSTADQQSVDMPWITFDGPARRAPEFPECSKIGLYPIIDRARYLPELAQHGVRTAQIRIKDLSGKEREQELQKAVACARSSGIRLFINDFWKLAIRLQAYGVHLGQEDLVGADLDRIRATGLRLGMSSHTLREAAVAHGISPSYVALGPILPTTCKSMAFGPRGFDRIRQWKSLMSCPVVAIGGLKVEHAARLVNLGADGVAVLSDLMAAPCLSTRIGQWHAVFAAMRQLSPGGYR